MEEENSLIEQQLISPLREKARAVCQQVHAERNLRRCTRKLQEGREVALAGA